MKNEKFLSQIDNSYTNNKEIIKKRIDINKFLNNLDGTNIKNIKYMESGN